MDTQNTLPRVLLCDDEVHIVKAASIKFLRAGFEVETAENGQVAWEMIQKRAPDAVVADYQMPYLNGLQLCKLIRDNPPTADIPVFLLTAMGLEPEVQSAPQDLRIDSVILKPFSPRELLRSVEQGIAARNAGLPRR
ncbi:MAG: response regulator [Planctomycetaceae bacterium]|nr:response regulator [Planctomycetaceae bacterium]